MGLRDAKQRSSGTLYTSEIMPVAGCAMTSISSAMLPKTHDDGLWRFYAR